MIMESKYHVDKISTDLDGIYIDSGADEFRICDNDCFDIPYNGKILNVPVNKNQTNVFIDNHIPYISTNINGKEIKLPLSNAVTYKKSNKYDLVDYCRDIQYTVEDFYNARGFETKKRKDYISRPKKSGYESRQCSFYSDDQNLGLECQIRTYDMEKYSNQERTYGYKPHESKISNNSLSSISRFALTTRFADGTIQTYTMSDAECFKYIYGMSLKEYRLKMRSAIEGKENNTSKGEAR